MYPFELDIIYGLIVMDNEERKQKEMQQKAKAKKGK
jgi:hypothetical protein